MIEQDITPVSITLPQIIPHLKDKKAGIVNHFDFN